MMTDDPLPNEAFSLPPSESACARPSYIVGVGASAGGLEALERLFQNMPADTGMAFVVVQHLSPDFKSLMNELLARWTTMPICAATNEQLVEANRIYLMPPKTEMIISDGRLLLSTGERKDELRLPIDQFFRSLARDVGTQAIAIVLSGTGSDGSRGIRDIQECGGLVIAQTEETAKFDGMPKSAVETGVVNLTLSPEEMPAALLRHTQRLATVVVPDDDTSGMTPIFRLLRENYSIDFSNYKPTTVLRRTERRLQLLGIHELEVYIERLKQDREELDSLYRDLLIGVTSFFRDREGFESLANNALPEIFQKLAPGEELRAWVAGCATGEEAYSLAILIHEQARRLNRQVPVKIFSTDVHQRSLEIAAAGAYSVSSMEAVSDDRLREYFVKTVDGYRVSTELRNMVVFAQHNIIKDAPFTRLNLITCRNLLIYLLPEAQKKAISLFHFGLKTGGALWLGPSESTGDIAGEFESIDAHWKLYRKRRDVRLMPDFRLPMSSGVTGHGLSDRRTSAQDTQLLDSMVQILGLTFGAAVLVNDQLEIEHTFGDAGRYITIYRGAPTLNLLEMLPRELRTAVSAAVHRARREKRKIVFSSIPTGLSEGVGQIDVSVQPLMSTRRSGMHLFIHFEDSKRSASSVEVVANVELSEATREHMDSIEAELRYTKENLQATIEELETSNEELQATNEELLASNEELQSTNEELHSVNEELYTVNAEYQKKIDELTELTRDVDNLLLSTDVHTIFLDEQLRIRKFTPRMAQVFNLIDSDVGRNIHGFFHSLQSTNLREKLEQVLATGTIYEEEVRTNTGVFFLMRILPYVGDAKYAGVVLTLIDITLVKEAEARFSNAVSVSPNGILTVDHNGLITMINAEVERIFGYSQDELLGKPIEVLVPAPEGARHAGMRMDFFRHPRLIRRMGGMSYVWGAHKDGSKIPLDVRVNPIETPTGVQAIASVVDFSEHQKLESTLREQVIQRDRFLATLSHELRNPIAAILTSASLLRRVAGKNADVEQPTAVIHRQTSHMATLLDDLLDVSRVTQGKIDLRLKPIDLVAACGEAIDSVSTIAKQHLHIIHTELPADPVYVNADRVRVLQIIENLLTNAIKYTDDSGDISVTLTTDSGNAVLRVRDNGCGMSKELLATIFDMFVQSDETLDRSQGGMGVGLTLVKSLVELHKGTIDATSGGKNRGSEFTVRLPLTDLRPAEAVKPASVLDKGKVSMVLVEDIEDSRTMFARLLRLEGYQVVATAGDGLEGLEAIERLRPDVALLDIGLPKIDGYELARRLRAQLGDSIFLIALTGYGRGEDHEAVLEAGFNAHLVKPVNVEMLNDVLEKPAFLNAMRNTM
jgi:two-component system, chemotaxis family, CheB/CheR fusion protein